MAKDFYIYNSLSRQKELFKPICPGMVGLYVCGPTVYGEAHLGHARPGITFDILVRWLRYSGYKVRYVRNITDVGHLENDADEGEDKIARKARLEALEPMEIVQTYTEAYHDAMRALNVAPPSIEPRASGHIIEQIATVQKILDAGFAYVSNGSVYFDVEAYDKKHKYGILSGRDLENTRENTRTLDGQDDKRSPLDFALWKKASPEHIMKWPSPWSEGFPGWHLECSTMSEKYLGTTFDIHGGGIDLKFPHHECELAQNTASRSTGGVRYWMHNNMITINGQKMGKSLGNFITLKELFSGSHKALEQAYSPMTIRFFILQAHYRSTLDFSNDALKAAGKGYKKLMQAIADFNTVKFSEKGEGNAELQKDYDGIFDSLNDDLNTPVALSFIFDAVRLQNQAKDGQITLDGIDRTILEEIWTKIVPDVLGLTDESAGGGGAGSQSVISGLMEMLLDVRKNARTAKDWPTCDMIRDRLNSLGIKVKDTKDGTEWSF